MRAVLVKNAGQSADDLYIGERPKPTPDSKEVLVKIVAFGINRMDIMQRKGGYPVPPDGQGVNIIVDFIGPDYWDKNVEALAKDGRMVLLASMSGPEIPKVNLVKLLYKRLRIQGSTLRSRSPEYQAALIKRFWGECESHFNGGELKVYIHKTYKWTEVAEAHKEMEANKTMGKIIVEIS
ncbi:Quinone oxidoreductase PIG3 OS=Homo sapiens GN=TP53I3 PE=1 SV=2 [Rhizoctonia solani AG-1 IB]|uniref:Quinone oxidoreductase PIG3 n=1 Tax=Thanatephorus cucumeris (strain AG1-IB / isolate 7/3/14) TaxID=1108050 RepID=A0A0B7FX49_THACB|nr:Quinone oxidoreductase PIG3 OS=Homo sapiens GN=TP53I3 PE=1 SV=2 [Rhizoctonia solani AG-1 IB]